MVLVLMQALMAPIAATGAQKPTVGVRWFHRPPDSIGLITKPCVQYRNHGKEERCTDRCSFG